MCQLTFYLILLFFIVYSESANILYVIPFTSMSHYIMLRPLGLELARRGHNVTVITAFKEENPPESYHQVMVDDKKIWDVLEIERPNIFTTIDMSDAKFHEEIIWKGGLGFTEVALNSSKVQEFLKEDNHFNLVIVEQFYEEAFYVLAHKYNAPLALITTFGNCMRHNILVRNPMQFSTVISEFIRIDEPASFYGRLKNFCFTVYEFLVFKYWYLGKQEELVKKYVTGLKEPVPKLDDIERSASLLLMNSHFSYDPPAAYFPNMVEIGGLHLTEEKVALPEDLQKLLDEARYGVIYMNFGSNIRSSELPADKKQAFLNVFRRLKQTVLWKWEEEQMEGKPDNLVIRKWMPQKEILSHPNVQVFISHGGLIGTQEALHHGVPIIGVPIYADQYNNLLQIQQMGSGRLIDYHAITEENFEKILKEVLTEKTYRDTAKVMSIRFKDRPLKALDTAMFWLEYVIRNDGAEYMKNPALKLTLVQYYMLDVFVFIFIVMSFVSWIVYWFLSSLVKLFFYSKKIGFDKKYI